MSDQEWRSRLFEEIKDLRTDIKEIKKEMTSLKIKVSAVSAFIGSIITHFLR